MQDTTTLAYVIQAIINQEYGDLRSILDEVYPSPSTDELSVLYNLLYVAKNVTFEYKHSTGWEYEEF